MLSGCFHGNFDWRAVGIRAEVPPVLEGVPRRRVENHELHNVTGKEGKRQERKVAENKIHG